MEPIHLVVKWPDAPAQIYRSGMIIYMMLLHSIPVRQEASEGYLRLCQFIQEFF
jgi:hypothetical protein